MLKRLLALFGVMLFLGAPAAQAGDESNDTQQLVDQARWAANNILNEPNYASAKEWMKEARGVIIVPRLLKAGFIVGGEGGNGVLLVKKDNGEWSYPAFYTLASGSVGLQMGLKDSQVLFIIRSRGAVDAILKDQVKLGAEVGVVAGTVGGNLSGSTTSSMGADIISYSLARGAFGGGSFEGSLIAKRSDFNKAYYGKEMTPDTILYSGEATNPGADSLRNFIAQY
jgi:lipid-binding SYLF domain-containing protein